MIDKNTTIKELALIVSTKLRESNIDTVLVGGAVVSIYTKNEYESGDLDFIPDNALEFAVVFKNLAKTYSFQEFR